MPFESQAQRGYMFVHHPKIAKEFAAATPKGAKLPYKVKQNAMAAGINRGLRGIGNGRGKGS